MMSRAGPVLLPLILVAAPGCLTTERLLQSRGTGEVRCFGVGMETLWPALVRALPRTGLEIVEADSSERILIARTWPGPKTVDDQGLGADQGERVAVFVDSAGPDVWAVEVVSRRYFTLDVTPKDWTDDVLLTITELLPEGSLVWDYDYPACRRSSGQPQSPPTAVRGPGAAVLRLPFRHFGAAGLW